MIWIERTAERTRYYLIPDAIDLETGECVLVNHAGGSRRVRPEAIVPFEVSEEQAVRWTRASLPDALTELRASLDSTLAQWRAEVEKARHTPVAPDTTITPAAVPALLDFLRALPGIVGQGISGDDARLATARQSLADLHQKLAAGGIETDDRLTGFADRLAGLRREMEPTRGDAPTEQTTRAQEPEVRPTGESDSGPSNEGSSL